GGRDLRAKPAVPSRRVCLRDGRFGGPEPVRCMGRARGVRGRVAAHLAPGRHLERQLPLPARPRVGLCGHLPGMVGTLVSCPRVSRWVHALPKVVRGRRARKVFAPCTTSSGAGTESRAVGERLPNGSTITGGPIRGRWSRRAICGAARLAIAATARSGVCVLTASHGSARTVRSQKACASCIAATFGRA